MLVTTGYRNKGRMADADGPACCVYSVKGCSSASIRVDFGSTEISLMRSDGRFVNAYAFLGMDIYDSDGNWSNCLDAGFCKCGDGGEWHLFYNLYYAPDGEATWYESSKPLKGDVYTLILDSSAENEYASISAYSVDGTLADTKTFPAPGAQSDGKNTSYLQDYALDFPEDLILGSDGKTTDDFTEVILYNTDQQLYMRNLKISEAQLCIDGTFRSWNTDSTTDVGIWPDKNASPGYDAVRVSVYEKYDTLDICLDMNRSQSGTDKQN